MVTGFVSVLDGSGSYHLHCEMNDNTRKRTQVICRHLQLKMGMTKMVSRMQKILGYGVLNPSGTRQGTLTRFRILRLAIKIYVCEFTVDCH